MRDFAVLKDNIDVRVGLDRLELTKDQLVQAVDAAFLARINTVPNHALNAAGTYSYHEGIRKLRDVLVGDNWTVGRDNNVEYVENSSLMVRIAFCNVVHAASLIHDPEPVSPRRNATIAACHANSRQEQLDFGPAAEHDHDSMDSEWITYYLMVGVDGTAELSLPLVCESGHFSELVERIFLITEDDLENDPSLLQSPDEEPEPEIDIVVNRKT